MLDFLKFLICKFIRLRVKRRVYNAFIIKGQYFCYYITVTMIRDNILITFIKEI